MILPGQDTKFHWMHLKTSQLQRMTNLKVIKYFTKCWTSGRELQLSKHKPKTGLYKSGRSSSVPSLTHSCALQKWLKRWETKLELLTSTHGTIESRFQVLVVVEASMSPSWTKAMLQGGPRVSVIPCYRSWVDWPAQHSTEPPDTERWVLCRNDLGGGDRAGWCSGRAWKLLATERCADQSTVHRTQWDDREPHSGPEVTVDIHNPTGRLHDNCSSSVPSARIYTVHRSNFLI